MLKNYLKLAVKVLARRRFFTFVSLFGISFTLAVLLVATALLDAVLAPRTPESRQDRMLINEQAVMYGPHSQWSSEAGYKLFDRYARDLPGAERVSIASSGDSVVSFVHGARVTSSLRRTDADFWRILDFEFVEGGPYTSADVAANGMVAVINEATRTKFFGDGQPVLGRGIEADGQSFRIIGVVRDVPETRFFSYADIWVPLTTAKTDGYKREIMGGFYAVVLAKDRTALKGIGDEFRSRLTRVELPNPKDYTTLVAPLEDRFDSLARYVPWADRQDPNPQGWKLIVTLTGLAFLFMLLPAVNLVNLNVSRIMERASEIGVRKAFGASSRTLVAQFVLENVVLTLTGAVVGILIAAAFLRLLNEHGPFTYAHLVINIRVLLYGLGLAVIFGVFSGVYPAWRMSRLHPVEALKGGNQ
jgi:putative ABC transport system permease protein